MPEETLLSIEQFHKKMGVDLFNFVWTMMEKSDRTIDDDDTMIHAAHASAHHWKQFGKPVNRARSEWQCSRVYTVLGRAEPALHHARRCLEICEASPDALEDWDLPFAHEALARAYSVAGELDEAHAHIARARELASSVMDDEDKALIESDLSTIAT